MYSGNLLQAGFLWSLHWFVYFLISESVTSPGGCGPATWRVRYIRSFEFLSGCELTTTGACQAQGLSAEWECMSRCGEDAEVAPALAACALQNCCPKGQQMASGVSQELMFLNQSRNSQPRHRLTALFHHPFVPLQGHLHHEKRVPYFIALYICNKCPW